MSSEKNGKELDMHERTLVYKKLLKDEKYRKLLDDGSFQLLEKIDEKAIDRSIELEKENADLKRKLEESEKRGVKV